VTTPEPVRIRLRYTDLDTFVERFAPNVTRGGVFLPSRAPRPVGEVLAFEVQLASGRVALAGTGKVIWVKQHNPAEPQKPHGMGVQFVQIDPATRATLDRMLKLRGSSKPGAGPAAGPRSPSQPVHTLAGGRTNGTQAARPPVDTSVDLAAEFGLDESALRRAAADGRWMVGGPRVADVDQELDELLKPEPAEPVTLAQALADLPRLLDPGARRRTGAFRALEITSSGPIRIEAPKADTPKPEGPGGGHGDEPS